MENQKKPDKFLSISILIAAVLIAGSLIYSAGLKNIDRSSNGQVKPGGEQILTGPETLQIGNDVVFGDLEAPVTIFVFSDYQCSFCVKFFMESELLIWENYIKTGKAKLIHKNLAILGPESIAAAQAVECAKDQEKYWQYHSALYDVEHREIQRGIANIGSGNLNRETFKRIASELEMNVDEFLSCFDSKKHAIEVEQDIEEAKAAIGQRLATPIIFINGEMIRGAHPYSVFVKAIEKALNHIDY